MRRAWQRLLASLRPVHDNAPVVAAAGHLTVADVVRRFWPRLRPLRGWLLLGLVMLVAAPAISVAEILLFQRLVDDVLVPATFGPLLGLALLYVGLNVLSGVVSGADDYLSTWVSQRFLVGLRRDAFAQVLGQPAATQDRRRLGDTLTRLTSDVAAVENFMVGQLTLGVGAVVRLVLFVGALFWLQWELAAASLVVVPVFWWVSTRFASFTRDVSRERRRRGGSLTSITEESLGNAALMQTYGREDAAVASYHEQNKGIADAELAGSRVRAVFLPLVDLAELLGVLVVVTLGVWALSTDRLTLGGLLAFLTLLLQCYRPVRDLSDLVPQLYSATAGVERLVELLDAPSAQDRPGATPLPPGPGAVVLRDVRVTYPGARTPALDGLTLDIAAGSCVAVVGESGSGKSTFARLLVRQLEADSGEVCLDGYDVADHTAASVRERVTAVPQEQLLLDASVRDNIAFARPDASDEEVEQAARLADAHGFVSRLPQGYDTPIGQRGRSLSGGQRQRIALARALLRGGRVLVLDEPTTGLDLASSRRLLAAVRGFADRRTVIMLTHDPVVVEHADVVLRLDAGRLVEPDVAADEAPDGAPDGVPQPSPGPAVPAPAAVAVPT
jgi:subfamily B ATP-binding cassette protein MsbA